MTELTLALCPTCNEGLLNPNSRIKRFQYKGHNIVFNGYVEYECYCCGVILCQEEMVERINNAIKDFKNKVDTGQFRPGNIII